MRFGHVGLTVLGLAALSTAALATPAMQPVFNKTYDVDKGSALGKARCGACHVGSSARLNPYGQDLKKALARSKKLTAAALEKIEEQDSDKDGKSNVAEIKAGGLPGAK